MPPTGEPRRAGLENAQWCGGVVETGAIRFFVSGDTPTSTTGIPVAAGQYLQIRGHDYLRAFRAIRSGASDGVWRVTCGNAPEPPVAVGAPPAAVTLEGAELDVGAQPADDPHFVRCSDGSVAAACDVALAAEDPGVAAIIAALEEIAIEGGATAANQETIIDHVDGVETLLTAIDSDTSRLTSSAAPVAPGTALATTAFVAAGTYNSAGVTLTDGQQAGLQFDAAGQVKVVLPAGGSGLTDAELRADPVEVEIVGGSTAGPVDDDDGSVAAGQEAALGIALNYIKSDGGAWVPAAAADATHDSAAFSTGPQVMLEAKTFDGSALPNAVAEGDAVRAAGTERGIPYVMLTNADGSVDYADALALESGGNLAAAATSLATLATYLQPGSMNRKIAAGTTEDETQIKASAGVLLSISAWNISEADAWVKCTNLTAANTTPGTSTVWYAMLVPSSTGQSGGFVQSNFGPGGVTFDTALTCYLVVGAADNDVAEVPAGEVGWNIVYR